MDYNKLNENSQLEMNGYLKLPSFLLNFNNTETTIEKTKTNRNVYCFKGNLKMTVEDYICPHCHEMMNVNNHIEVSLKHLNVGANLGVVNVSKVQFYCEKCNKSRMQEVQFKADGHNITKQLYQYTLDLLSSNKYTLKQVAEITGLCKNTVKEIDLERLKNNYIEDGKLKKLKHCSRFLGIDEFKLHDGYIYATHIIDLETGEILYIAHGKKKQVVYDFINYVGLEWMSHVISVACDMNSDFEEAFEEKCPHIKIVFDHFHIVKNFNEKVISNIRKDEQKRLKEEGNETAAKILKRSKYILCSNRNTLKRKDNEVKENKVISKGSTIFNKPEITRKGNYEQRYDELIKENKLLFTIDLVKEKLNYAYTLDNEEQMKKEIDEIIELCDQTNNEHFKWFSNLIKNHYDGIIAHATYKISSGKIEGTNNKIKTLRRQSYGFPDDEYFFLKLIDMSRQK